MQNATELRDSKKGGKCVYTAKVEREKKSFNGAVNPDVVFVAGVNIPRQVSFWTVSKKDMATSIPGIRYFTKTRGPLPINEPERHVKSIVLHGFGKDGIKIEPWPLPTELQPCEVEVDVDTCGVNFADLAQKQGLVSDMSVPFAMGYECSGRVTRVGENVKSIKVDDNVVCYQQSCDLFRQTVIVPERNCFKVPNSANYEDAVCLCANYITAYFALFVHGNLLPGHFILILSCTGGVGWAATQLAHTVESVRVVGTASTQKHHFARTNGVTHVFPPDNYEEKVMKISPCGYDLIIDSKNDGDITNCLKLLSPLGKLIITGGNSIPGQKVSFWNSLKAPWVSKAFSPLDLIISNRSVCGFHLGKLLAEEPEKVNAVMGAIFDLHRLGKISPHVDSAWPFERINDALTVLSTRKNTGKVILKAKLSKTKSELNIVPELDNVTDLS